MSLINKSILKISEEQQTMNNSCSFGSIRGYSEILLEEIALEGLDGITLETLWKRLQYNPDWKLFPIDDYIEQFIWKYLVGLQEVEWFVLPQPRRCPRIFATFDELLDANTKDLDLYWYSSESYPHFPINDNDIVGSCPTYYRRTNVTEDIQNFTIEKAKNKWGNKLVIVASQTVRNSVLLPHDENPDLELADMSYFMLERIGRARRCGESSLSLNFLKNGANPTFYFWNKLRKRKIICSQIVYSVSAKTTSNTLFHLPQFYKRNMEGICGAVKSIINDVKASSQKACLYTDMKEKYFSLKPKITKTEYFRRFLKVEFMDYDEFYNSNHSLSNTPNKCKKVLRVIKLAEQTPEPVIDEPMEVDDDEETENVSAILKGNRVLNRPLLSQCYLIIDEAGTEGISMVDVGRTLGVTKLMTRQLVRTLSKHNFLISLSSDNARKRYFRYFSKRFSEQVTSKIEEQFHTSMEMFEITPCRVQSEDNEEKGASTISNVNSSESDNRLQGKIQNKNTSPNKRPLPFRKDENEKDAKRRKINENKTINKGLKNKQNDTVALKSQCMIPANESIFVMRRMNIILKEVNERHVILRRDVAKIVHDEEIKRKLYQGFPDRRSITKVLNILTNNGKIIIIKKLITNEARNKSREIEFVCVPDVDDNHPIIVAAIQEAKSELAITYVKKGSGALTTNSILMSYPVVTRKSSKYGCAPKFSRMKLLHELLVYVSYQYEGDENLDQDECKKYLSPLYAEDDDAKENLPKCYTKEISWKMFIPPLMKYEEYKDGWLSQNDLTDRLPLNIFFALIHSRFENPNIDLYLQHPIKQYYLMRHLPHEIQEYLTVDNAYMYSLHLNFRNLCMIGLTQFGPRTKTRGFQNLVYVNKKTQLLDTRSCPAAHMRINPTIDYTRSDYDFTQPADLERYWNNAMRFCLGTKLGRKRGNEVTAPFSNRIIPDALRSSMRERMIEEAPLLDMGEVPGDRLGAGGYDSWHYSHFIKQWMINKSKEKTKSPITATSNKILVTWNVPKSRRFRNYMTRRNIPLKKCEKRRTKFDKVDAEALKKLKTLRATWRKNEDEILLLCHVASKFYNPNLFPTYKPYKLFRKLLHESSEMSACKTKDAIKRRLNSLLKNSVRKHSVRLLIKEMTEDKNFKKKFEDTIVELEQCIAEKQNIEDALDKLTEKVFYHLYTNKTAVFKKRSEVTLPDDIEVFRKDWNYEYAISGIVEKKVWTLSNKQDVIVLAIINLSLSTLLSQVEKDKVLNINFLFRTFRLFDDDQVKFAHNYLRGERMISYNKYNEKQHSAYVPFGKGIYHLSISYHIILKAVYNLSIFAQVYANYLELVSKHDCENIELTNYESGYNLMLISLLTSNRISFEISFPEYVLTFTKPAIIDPSEVTKPILEAKCTYTDKTLALIRDSFFKNKSNLPAKISTENVNDLEGSDERDSEPDIGDEADDIEENLIDYNSSKIAIFITKLNFKQADIRFSNAYDHFLINPFRLKCNISSGMKCDTFVMENRENFLKRLEENAWYSKVKITSNELMLKIRKLFRKPNQRDCAISLIEFLHTKGPCGATYEMLKNEFNDISLLKKTTEVLLKNKLLIRNGTQYTHFVHLDFAENWLLSSYKNKNIVCEETDSGCAAKAAVINRRSLDETEQMNDYCESVWVSIRPWVYLNGTINVAALESFLIRILSFAVKNPGCCLKEMQKKFIPALQPHMTRELIEFLLQLKCLQLKAVVVNRKVTLFTKPTSCSVIDYATGYEDEQDIIIEPEVNALVKLSIFIGNVNYKDLLEMKSYDVSCAAEQRNEETQNISEIEIQNVQENNDENVDVDEDDT